MKKFVLSMLVLSLLSSHARGGDESWVDKANLAVGATKFLRTMGDVFTCTADSVRENPRTTLGFCALVASVSAWYLWDDIQNLLTRKKAALRIRVDKFSKDMKEGAAGFVSDVGTKAFDKFIEENEEKIKKKIDEITTSTGDSMSSTILENKDLNLLLRMGETFWPKIDLTRGHCYLFNRTKGRKQYFPLKLRIVKATYGGYGFFGRTKDGKFHDITDRLNTLLDCLVGKDASKVKEVGVTKEKLINVKVSNELVCTCSGFFSEELDHNSTRNELRIKYCILDCNDRPVLFEGRREWDFILTSEGRPSKRHSLHPSPFTIPTIEIVTDGEVKPSESEFLAYA